MNMHLPSAAAYLRVEFSACTLSNVNGSRSRSRPFKVAAANQDAVVCAVGSQFARVRLAKDIHLFLNGLFFHGIRCKETPGLPELLLQIHAHREGRQSYLDWDIPTLHSIDILRARASDFFGEDVLPPDC